MWKRRSQRRGEEEKPRSNHHHWYVHQQNIGKLSKWCSASWSVGVAVGWHPNNMQHPQVQVDYQAEFSRALAPLVNQLQSSQPLQPKHMAPPEPSHPRPGSNYLPGHMVTTLPPHYHLCVMSLHVVNAAPFCRQLSCALSTRGHTRVS